MELMRAIRVEWIKVMRSRVFRGALILAAVIMLMIIMALNGQSRSSVWFPFYFLGVHILFQILHLYDLIAIAFAATFMAKEIRDGDILPRLAGLSRRWTLYAAKWISIASALAIVVAALTLFSLVVWFLLHGPLPASRPVNLLLFIGMMMMMALPGMLLAMSAVMLIGQFTGPEGAVVGGMAFVGALEALYDLVPAVRDYLPVKPLELSEEPYVPLALMALYIAVVAAAGILVFGRRDFAGRRLPPGEQEDSPTT